MYTAVTFINLLLFLEPTEKETLRMIIIEDLISALSHLLSRAEI